MYFCFHLIVVAVAEGKTTIPVKYIKDPVVRKEGAGRKSHAETALKRQKN